MEDQESPIVERPYACPKCGWGQHRAHGTSRSVDIAIDNGQISLVDAEDFEAEVECAECGAIFDIIYPPVGNFGHSEGDQETAKVAPVPVPPEPCQHRGRTVPGKYGRRHCMTCGERVDEPCQHEFRYEVDGYIYCKQCEERVG